MLEPKNKGGHNLGSGKKKWKSQTKGRGGLTPKQAKLVANKVKGMTDLEAYKNSYEPVTKNPRSINTMAFDELHKPHVRKALNDALDKAGVTEEYVVGEAKALFERCEKDNDKLASLKLLAELKRLIGRAAASDEGIKPQTVNILNVKLDKMDDKQLVEFLRDEKNKESLE